MKKAWIFRPAKLQQGGFFDQRNYTEKSTWKQLGFFHHRNYVEKSAWKQCGFFDYRK